MAEPELLARGDEAKKRISGLSYTELTIKTGTVMGDVTIKSGTIWSGYSRMIVAVVNRDVFYTVDDKLYRLGVSDFIRDELMSAFEKAGKSAAPWIEIGKAEFEFIMGVVMPTWGAVLFAIAKAAFFYVQHKATISVAWELNKELWDILVVIQKKCPRFMQKLAMTTAKEAIKDAVFGAPAPQEAAKLLGRIVRNLVQKTAAAAEAGSKVAGAFKLTIQILVKVILETAALVRVLNIPSRTGAAITKAAAGIASEVEKILKAAGAPLSRDEARLIAEEIIREKDDLLKKFTRLEEINKQLIPKLEELEKALKEM